MSSFSVWISIRKTDGDKEDPVFFKVDGGRFECDKTLKLTTDTNYVVEFQGKPHANISHISILGTHTTATETKDKNGDIKYKCDWTTSGLEPTKKGTRKTIEIVFMIDDKSLTVSLQCKLYSKAEIKHINWGTQLHHIEYKCKHLDGTSFLDIMVTVFR